MDAYYASPEWVTRRRDRLALDGHHCQLGQLLGWACDETRLEVHHLTYDRFGHEEMDDLITLCEACHTLITSTIRQRRYQALEMPRNDAGRTAPLPPEVPDAIQDTQTADHRRVTPTLPQWADGGPAERLCEADEEDFGQEGQDRGGSQGTGKN